MDESQWVPFAFAMVQFRDQLQASVNNTTREPRQMIIQGEGGSGTSWLNKHIVKDVHNVFCEHSATRRSSKRVLLLAHQGTAAFNIKGQTTCLALELTSFSRNAFSSLYSSLTTQKGGATKLKRLQEQYKDVQLVIIDEFSVISCGMLYWIDERMREIWPQHSQQRFGGRDVIFTGDSAQLDPVIPHALATPSSKISRVQVLGREIWEEISIVWTLTSQNRGKADPEWFEALRKANEIPTWAVEAKHIAYLNAEVAEANSHSLKSCSNPIINIRSKHSVKLKRLAKHRDVSPSSNEALLQDAESSSSDRDRVFRRHPKIAIGAPVSLPYNM
ncbi:Ribosomal silencing factor RsfS [Phytophthora nicotianae]|uniref:ATP-dependent DNA helicase n=1 Tax=Phytophthora nicotianae TaxID=4792 RepID=A0A0W8CQD3_PHYNI|nr:Ribosomal silencing factor RsfS [Phytophthora nicotianae]